MLPGGGELRGDRGVAGGGVDAPEEPPSSISMSSTSNAPDGPKVGETGGALGSTKRTWRSSKWSTRAWRSFSCKPQHV
jgi:hypothetical protein